LEPPHSGHTLILGWGCTASTGSACASSIFPPLSVFKSVYCSSDDRFWFRNSWLHGGVRSGDWAEDVHHDTDTLEFTIAGFRAWSHKSRRIEFHDEGMAFRHMKDLAQFPQIFGVTPGRCGCNAAAPYINVSSRSKSTTLEIDLRHRTATKGEVSTRRLRPIANPHDYSSRKVGMRIGPPNRR
jgi:hypothetical protein